MDCSRHAQTIYNKLSVLPPYTGFPICQSHLIGS
jgi:hypothetical protein